MSAHDNAALARKIYQLFNEGQFDDAITLATEDVELVLVPFGQTFHGRAGFRAFLQGFHSAFPDIHITVTNQVAADDQVVTEFTARGTHTRPLPMPAGEVAPTGRVVDFTVCEVWRVRDGKLASLHNYQDVASMMRQLGLIA
jgi:steroid delta-isomerase-like uncharacterized protein